MIPVRKQIRNRGSDEEEECPADTYDDRNRIIWMREINYERNYDFENTISSFCEIDRPLVRFYVERGRKDGVRQRMTEHTCECTYQPSGTQSGVSQAPVIVNVDWNSVNNSISTAPAAGNDQNVNATVGSQFEVPADVLNNLAGKDTTLFLHTGSGIAFSLSGSDVKTGDASFKVTMTSGDVPEEAKQQVLTGAYASRSFGMSEKGDYSIPVSVHMNLGKENAGKQAFLYSYDEETGTMKLVGTFTVTEQGQAMFGISRGDEYIAVVADKAVEGIGNASQGSGRTYTVKNGDTLFGIARRNGVNVNTLIQANPQIRNINNIHPGWIINIR